MPLVPLDLLITSSPNRLFSFFLRRLIWTFPDLSRSISLRLFASISAMPTRCFDSSVSSTVSSWRILKSLAIPNALYISYFSPFLPLFHIFFLLHLNICSYIVSVSDDFYGPSHPDFVLCCYRRWLHSSYMSFNLSVLHLELFPRIEQHPCLLILPIAFHYLTIHPLASEIFLLGRFCVLFRRFFYTLLTCLSSIHPLFKEYLSIVCFICPFYIFSCHIILPSVSNAPLILFGFLLLYDITIFFPYCSIWTHQPYSITSSKMMFIVKLYLGFNMSVLHVINMFAFNYFFRYMLLF